MICILPKSSCIMIVVPNVRVHHKLAVHFRVEQLEQFISHLNDFKETVEKNLLLKFQRRTSTRPENSEK